ncbi:MAG: hypothetical protein IKF99_05130, partial [Oscillospiraceae bacterium]|nr:hypothetical protein [Oscillospiraceae bacterium]
MKMKNKRYNGLRMTCVLLMLLTPVFVGRAMAYADDENAPAAEQEVIDAFARAAHDYFNGMSQKEINEVSEKLVGYSLAEVENYFP